jgi:hypothetical protein
METNDITDDTIFDEDGEPINRTSAFLPVHPNVRDDIRHISKHHLLLRYDFQSQNWMLEVLGNGAFVNDKHFQRNATIALDHNDYVQLSSLGFTFKLPDNPRSPGLSRGTFDDESDEGLSEEDDQLVSTSPVRRLSNAI